MKVCHAVKKPLRRAPTAELPFAPTARWNVAANHFASSAVITTSRIRA
jgi:hypothetical protein